MDDKMKKEFTVNGFIFGSVTDLELAKNELGTVKYIDKKIENRSANTILSVYQGAIDRKMFRTPIGYAYLHDLQKRMVSLGMPKDNIPGIPLYQVYNNSISEDIKRSDRDVTVSKKKKKDALKAQNRRLIIAVVVMAAIIISLFIISINANTPNIINYRNNIQNEYADWEQELTERERAVKEKEREIQQTYGRY